MDFVFWMSSFECGKMERMGRKLNAFRLEFMLRGRVLTMPLWSPINNGIDSPPSFFVPKSAPGPPRDLFD